MGVIFPRCFALSFLSQIGTVFDARDLDLRKRASRFKFCAVAARKNCSRTCFILRKRTLRNPIWFFNSAKCFYFPALALRGRDKPEWSSRSRARCRAASWTWIVCR